MRNPGTYFGEVVAIVAFEASFVDFLPCVSGIKRIAALAACQLGPIVGVAARHPLQLLVAEFGGLIRVLLFLFVYAVSLAVPKADAAVLFAVARSVISAVMAIVAAA